MFYVTGCKLHCDDCWFVRQPDVVGTALSFTGEFFRQADVVGRLKLY